MWPLALTLALGATQPGPARVAVPAFSVAELDERRGAYYGEYFAQQLAVHAGVSVVPPPEVTRLLGPERERQLLGCSAGASSCLAELAAALRADAVVRGSLARVAKGFAVSIKALDPANGRTLLSRSGRLDDENALLYWLDEVAWDTARAVTEARRPAGGGLKPEVLIPGLGGAALLVGGGVFLGLAASTEQSLRDGTATVQQPGDLASVADRGRQQAVIGYVGLGVGLAAVGIAAALALVGESSGPGVTISAGPGGAGLVFHGVLP
ncbi:MAG: hypothetical protein ACYC8T_01685 [Myxococcaceae bacterium]